MHTKAIRVILTHHRSTWSLENKKTASSSEPRPQVEWPLQLCFGERHHLIFSCISQLSGILQAMRSYKFKAHMKRSVTGAFQAFPSRCA